MQLVNSDLAVSLLQTYNSKISFYKKHNMLRASYFVAFNFW